MDEQTFGTIIKEKHKFGGNDFIVGKISGIGYMCCGKTRYAMAQDPKSKVLYIRYKCTKEQYEKFVEIVEGLYPGLCEFYSSVEPKLK